MILASFLCWQCYFTVCTNSKTYVYIHYTHEVGVTTLSGYFNCVEVVRSFLYVSVNGFLINYVYDYALLLHTHEKLKDN